ncbi:hypothetical protein [Piscinibacter koreensis]|uniref:Uncharacterized protein n=1 Tax=Piscinibacter koreensis TaxID=2742824 RepID=A0A7Y6TY52_9BURK|nr:hypothetical protein [Schlegelella koreensis]NUZ07757.1 hypothetical protein [Schlegelella koreensis]
MGKLLYRASAADGSERSGIVRARSSAEARSELQGKGLGNVVFHNELLADIEEAPASASAREAEALARFKIRLMEKPGTATVLGEVARRLRWLIAACIATALAAWWLGSWTLLALSIGALVLPFAAVHVGAARARRYQAMLRAFALGDAETVRRQAARIRRGADDNLQLQFELDVRLARLDAPDGKLQEALAALEPWRDRLADSPGLFDALVGTVHLAGGDRAGFVDATSRASAASGAEPGRVVDHALANARFGDVDEAARLAASVDASLLPPYARGFVAWTDGLIRARRGAPGAVDVLAQATNAFAVLSTHPAAWTSLAFCACDHALALNRAGRLGEARGVVAGVWPVLSAHADAPLLRELARQNLVPTPVP